MFSRRKKDGNPGCQYVEDENGPIPCGRPVESSTVDTSEAGDGSKMELEWKVYCRYHLEEEDKRIKELETKTDQRERDLGIALRMTDDLGENLIGLVHNDLHGHLFYLNSSRNKIRDISAIIEQEHAAYLAECRGQRAEKTELDKEG